MFEEKTPNTGAEAATALRAYQRLAKSDVKYRFSIDMASLKGG